MKLLPLVLFTLLAPLAAAPAPTAASPGPIQSSAQASDPLVVYTTFYPTTFFAERIGGEAVEVVCPLPADADPIFWKPERETLRAYQGADLVVVNGAEFEKWVAQASLPLRTRVDTARSFRSEWLRYAHARTHRHGPGGEHTHAGIDGHTWVDPFRARQQAAAIRDGLTRARPELAEAFDAGFVALEEELTQLENDFRELGKLPEEVVLLASHPAYNYLAQRMGWDVVSLDLDPESVPTADQLAAARAELAGRRALVLLWEAEPIEVAVQRVRVELGIDSVLFSPCETLPRSVAEDGGDYLDVMRANLDRLAPYFEDLE